MGLGVPPEATIGTGWNPDAIKHPTNSTASGTQTESADLDRSPLWQQMEAPLANLMEVFRTPKGVKHAALTKETANHITELLGTLGRLVNTPGAPTALLRDRMRGDFLNIIGAAQRAIPEWYRNADLDPTAGVSVFNALNTFTVENFGSSLFEFQPAKRSLS